jgi:hypothetical protein
LRRSFHALGLLENHHFARPGQRLAHRFVAKFTRHRDSENAAFQCFGRYHAVSFFFN